MEDRAGVRRCVTCELFNEKLAQSGQIIAEVPLQGEELAEAVDEVPTTTEKKVEKKSKPTPSPTLKTTPKPKKILKKVTIDEENESDENAIDVAREAVLRKIQWATAELDATKETARVLDFLAVIKTSAETLKALQI
uniref:Uncharacterized protein n=1 Tax=Caenorhabditis japonica TaxID=281687 RepID=A0A8R1IU03_CAEJA